MNGPWITGAFDLRCFHPDGSDLRLEDVCKEVVDANTVVILERAFKVRAYATTYEEDEEDDELVFIPCIYWSDLLCIYH